MKNIALVYGRRRSYSYKAAYLSLELAFTFVVRNIYNSSITFGYRLRGAKDLAKASWCESTVSKKIVIRNCHGAKLCRGAKVGAVAV